MKKSIRILQVIGMSLMILIGVSCMGARTTEAAEEPAEEEGELDLSDQVLQSGGLLAEDDADSADVPALLASVGNSQRTAYLEDLMTSAWDSFTTYVKLDTSKYKYTPEEVGTFFAEVLNSHYEYFYVSSKLSYSYSSSSKAVTSLTFSYTTTQSKAKSMRAELDAEINKVDAAINSSWSDLEIVLYLNDYLARQCEYDTTYSKYNAYNALVERKAVCQGYVLAFEALSEKVGVEAEMVTSLSLDHAWTFVKVGNSFYHLDVTWNDPVNNRIGRVDHHYFLKSNSFFRSTAGAHNASDWVFSGHVTSADATSTAYDNYFWNDIGSGFEHIGKYWYAVDDNAINTYTCSGSSFAKNGTLIKISDKWPVLGGSGNYSGNYTYLASYNGMLYYNLSTTICEYSPDTGKSKVIYTLPSSYSAKGRIYGMHMLADTEELEYLLASSPDGGSANLGYHRLAIPEHTHHLTRTAAKAATCTTDGNIEYWHCSDCKEYFSDSKGTNHISKNSTVIAATGHKYTVTASKAATSSSLGYKDYKCSNCGNTYREYLTADGKKDLSGATITLSKSSYTYDGTAKNPGVTVTYGPNTLKSGTDYSVSYKNNKNAGSATVTVTAKGSTYAGSKSKHFTINKAAQKITVGASSYSVKVGKSVTITAKSTAGSLSYHVAGSSDSSYISVTSKGKVTGKKAGTAKVKITAAATGNYQSATQTVKVKVTGGSSSSSSSSSGGKTSGSGSGKTSSSKSSYANAETVTINGLKYTTTSPSAASVTGVSKKSLTTAAIPSSVTIGGSTYKVTAIGSSAFKGCTKLKSVQISSKVKKIGSKAFYQCTALTKITIPSGVTSVGSSAFSGCTKMKTASVGKAVKTIGSKAFYHCTALTKVTGCAAVTTVKSSAFSGDKKLESVGGMTKLTSIGGKAFYKCSKLARIGKIKAVVTLGKVKTIGASAFSGCKKIKKVKCTSSTSLTKIGSSAFANCTALEYFESDSKSLKSIGKKAFYGDKKLGTVILKTKKLKSSNVKADAFKKIKSTCTFQVPSSKVSSYKKIFKSSGAGSKIKVKKV